MRGVVTTISCMNRVTSRLRPAGPSNSHPPHVNLCRSGIIPLNAKNNAINDLLTPTPTHQFPLLTDRPSELSYTKDCYPMLVNKHNSACQ
jgi:hypothetical protein